MIDAFDSDILIYAAVSDPRGRNVRPLIHGSERAIGSLILIPEVLAKPTRMERFEEVRLLTDLLHRLDLQPVDEELADAAASFAAAYKLRTADSIHLATAVIHGADRFHTNNRKDFGPHIEEVEVVWPVGAR